MPARPLLVDSLWFDFDSRVKAQLYDKWQHYAMIQKQNGGLKAVDVVAIESSSVTWLIEAKDFRMINAPPRPSNIGTLAETVEKKVRDSLTGLKDAAKNAKRPSERKHAQAALKGKRRRVVLHLEPHVGPHSRLFPANFPVNVYQKLKALVSDIDSTPLVLQISNTSKAGVPWSVR